jgi:hypothetical protein
MTMFIFETITIAVGVVGVALYGTPYLRPQRTLGELGRHGGSWFDHADEMELADLPDENTDPPIPVRPLRSRLR